MLLPLSDVVKGGTRFGNGRKPRSAGAKGSRTFGMRSDDQVIAREWTLDLVGTIFLSP